MITDLSWMLQDIVDNVPHARHAVLLSADGLPRGATEGLGNADVGTVSAAMAGLQALSGTAARFVGHCEDNPWQQTVVEFEHGWIFLIGAGQGACLAAAAAIDVDLQQISFRMHRLVARLGSSLTSPPRPDTGPATERPGRPRIVSGDGGRPVLAELDAVIDEVGGARHAVLLGADGLPRGATSGVSQDLADTVSAAMTGIHAYSRAAERFTGAGRGGRWRQTVIEYRHGWVFLISARDGALLVGAAGTDTDIERFTARLHQVAPGLGAGHGVREEARST
ncbi:roadblock/LC7 domain-containing protein [Streptomyces sp. NPDC048409]|uniref:roadblock/LC7 domain-containing protein n=1 Tax=Streptomyces sp. NPDC048409 TaxID=3154723 RepID=UPI003432E2B4